MGILKDISISAVVTGLITVLVGYTSAGVIVFQAAQSLGASPAEIGSWFWALGWGMGLTSLVLSLRYRVPIITAWSTPGAALIATGASSSLAEATGAFLICAALITLFGFTGWFERLMNQVPLSLAAAMLAGVLLQFGLNIFIAMQTQLLLALAMFCVYVVMRRMIPRYAVIGALVVGILIAGVQGTLALEVIDWRWATPIFTRPAFSGSALIGIALPLFLVTMASQNVPGVATIRAFEYQVPTSPLIGWTGAASLIFAPFGAFAVNLAAITAAIAMGREAHEDPEKRYIAGVAVGLLNIVIGLFGATVSSLFAALPQELVLVIAGLALLGTIGNGLMTALGQPEEREPALVTFLVTASGMTLFGIGSAFWGLLLGILTLTLSKSSALAWRQRASPPGRQDRSRHR